MNETFIVGKSYKLRKDYPEFTGTTYAKFEGRDITWTPKKQPIILNRKFRKVLFVKDNTQINKMINVEFEGIESSQRDDNTWLYHPKDFINMIEDWRGEFE